MLSLEIKGKKVNFIGDPHLGKKFSNVPLHRKGERERLQMAEFIQQLEEPCDICIMVGDLFDVHTISNELLLEVFYVVLGEAYNSPGKRIVFISGNHDITRDAETKGSFHILETMFQTISLPNVVFTSTSLEYKKDGLEILLLPYSEYKSAEESVAEFHPKGYDLIVGHWDTMVVSGEHNFIPCKKLSEMTKIAVTGHVHIPEEFYISREGTLVKTPHETKVYVTGSMQPYSHGEDPDGKFYITKTLQEVQEALAINPDAFADKALRISVKPGETPPDNLECLQLSYKYQDDQPQQKLEVTSEEFCFKDLFFGVMKSNEIPDEVANNYWNDYTAKVSDA